jgi:uncharacterized protein YndB with AHSA1/START domain
MTKRTKITMEFEIKSSPNILFNYISSPSGLSEWFAEDVNVQNKMYTFFWDGEENTAEMIKKVNGKNVRFKWEDSEEEEYFEMEVKQDELTNDIALVVTDFINEEDVEETQMLWESQIGDLRTAIGAF